MLKVSDVTLCYGHTSLVSDIHFALASGKIGCLLGPSGSGKTSLLRAIAGFMPIVNGSIELDRQLLSSATDILPAEQRNIGMVFQDYALFPHLSVLQNVLFGLHKMPTDEAQRRAADCLSLVGLAEKHTAFPHQLSGGQQQRVALARAIAPKPKLLLLDEPFSSLDLALRESLANDIRRVLKEEGITALLVTHDQKEAFAVADEIGVLANGKLQQWGTAHELYQTPVNTAVAEFIGEGVVLHSDKRKQSMLLRPENTEIVQTGQVKGEITGRFFRGDHFIYHVHVDEIPNFYSSSCIIHCMGKASAKHDMNDQVYVNLHTDKAIYF